MYNIRGMCRSHTNTRTHTNARALRQKRARVVYWTSLGVKSNNADTPQCNCLTRVFKGPYELTDGWDAVLQIMKRILGYLKQKKIRLNFIKSWLLKPFTAALKWKMMALSVERYKSDVWSSFILFHFSTVDLFAIVLMFEDVSYWKNKSITRVTRVDTVLRMLVT